jgi:ubiquinone/menaquinone biosynthesis C-methylase UbiE
MAFSSTFRDGLDRGSMYRDVMQNQDSLEQQQQDEVTDKFERTAEYWKQAYQERGIFETIYQQRQQTVLALFSKLGLSSDSKLLEIGCGAGYLAVALAKQGSPVQTIDVARNMVGLTQRLATDAGVGELVTVGTGDAHALHFEDNSFRAVFALGVTPWLHTLRRALQEIARVLEPGGYVIITADNRWRLTHLMDPFRLPAFHSTRLALRKWIDLLQRRNPRSRHARAKMYSPGEFDVLLKEAGFVKLDARSVGFGPFTVLNLKILPESLGVRVHSKLQTLADNRYRFLRFMGAQYVVVAKKACPPDVHPPSCHNVKSS